MRSRILVTGGAGYIGSHTVLSLLEEGHEVIVLDNLCNSSARSLERVALIAGCKPVFIHGDIRDRMLLRKIFSQQSIDAVFHFAGLKAVGESVDNPLAYYDTNVTGTLNLCQSMSEAKLFKLIFSSSATVYGDVETMPISEDTALGLPTNPYGRSKLIIEKILTDLALSEQNWRIGVLRYFNPVGAHASGLLGEHPNGVPNNLVPYITQVAVGKLKELTIFGDDYATSDGTGIRDYIHVVDLAIGHLRALKALDVRNGLQVWNLGTGKGYSVFEIVRAFEKESGLHIPFRIASRREGDVAACWANPAKAYRELAWKAERDLSEMMRDVWCWQVTNPDGYSNDDDM